MCLIQLLIEKNFWFVQSKTGILFVDWKSKWQIDFSVYLFSERLFIFEVSANILWCSFYTVLLIDFSCGIKNKVPGSALHKAIASNSI